MTLSIPNADEAENKIEIKIDPDYASLVPPLSDHEYQGLERSIIEHNGNIEPIVVSKHDKFYVIVDGHHRYRICTKHGLKPRFIEIRFDSRLQEKLYVIDSNEGRNLNTYQKLILLSTKWTILKTQAEKRIKAGVKLDPRQLVDKGRVDAVIGKQVGVSHELVRRFRIVEEKGNKKQKQQLEKGGKKIGEIYDEIHEEEEKQKQIVLMKEHAQNLDQKSLEELAGRFQLIHGDALIERQTIPDNSIDLIFTDPPYLEKDLWIYAELRKIAARVLKPGGSLFTYAPHIHLKKVYHYMEDSSGQFKDYWIICNKQEVPTQTYGRHVVIHWKPLLWYVKGKLDDRVIKPMHDLIESDMPDKTTHEWAQSTVEAEEVIKILTRHEDETVLDLFAGDGTTAVACIRQRRKFRGYEIDKDRHANAVLRIKEALWKFQQQEQQKEQQQPQLPAKLGGNR